MLDKAIYLVTEDIARRSGLANARYRIRDGRFVLDNKDLSRVRFTANEYINGLSGVESISLSQAKSLILENGYKMGLEESVVEPSQLEETQISDVTQFEEGNENSNE